MKSHFDISNVITAVVINCLTLCLSANYSDLYQWSVDNYSEFWGEAWRFCGIVSSKLYEEVSPLLSRRALFKDIFQRTVRTIISMLSPLLQFSVLSFCCNQKVTDAEWPLTSVVV